MPQAISVLHRRPRLALSPVLLAVVACAGPDPGADTDGSSSSTTTTTTTTGATSGTTEQPTTAGPGATSDTTAAPDTTGTTGASNSTDTSAAETGAATTAATTGGPDGLFPIEYDVSQIEVVDVQSAKIDGAPHTLTLYRNLAYRCGRTDYYTFLVVERDATIGQPAPLWFYLRGGGAGYYDEGGVYVGDESMNDQWALNTHAAALLQIAFSGTPQNATTKATVAGKRVAEGYRLISPSFCDHDLYLGPGHDYPNNPNWGGEDTVDGLLATMAAIDFTARGNGSLPGHHGTHIFVHGTSAGSPGAYGVAHAFAASGVSLTGVVLDSFVLSGELAPLFADGCTELQQSYPGFSIDQATVKHGPYAADPALHLSNTLGAGYSIPSFVLLGGQDTFCCGPDPALPAANADGYSNNCEWSYRLVFDAIDGAGSPLFDRLYLPGKGHVLTKDADAAVHTPIEGWFDAVMAAAPAPPWP